MFDNETGLAKCPEDIWDKYRQVSASFNQLYESEEAAYNHATKHKLTYFSIIPVYF